MTLDALGLIHTMENLKRGAIRIFGTYNGQNASPTGEKGVDKTFSTTDSATEWDGEEEEPEDKIYFIKKRRQLKTVLGTNKCR